MHPKLNDLTKEQMFGEVADKKDLNAISSQIYTFILEYAQKKVLILRRARRRHKRHQTQVSGYVNPEALEYSVVL
jgi:hypothetical protein